MYKKYFAWSFDDGLEQDKKIIEILKRYDMGAAFNLNSGMYGDKTYEGRIGNLGFTEKPADKFNVNARHVVPYVPHFRIPEDEVKDVYEGYEIASHGLCHRNLKRLKGDDLREELATDIHNLRDTFGQEIKGFVAPYGMYNSQATPILKSEGIEYVRMTKTDTSFRFPADPYNLPMTCWHISSKTFDTLNDFFSAEPIEEDLFFLMFAHGYEFDFGTKESNWEKFERICEAVAKHDDIVKCSVNDALKMHKDGYRTK